MVEMFRTPSPMLPTGMPSAQEGDADVNEAALRIEALKIRLLSAGIAGEDERIELMRELNMLRDSLLRVAARSGPPEPSAEPARLPAVPRRRSDGPKLEIDGILGQHPVILQNLKRIAAIAETQLSVLLEGETGTGKDVFARIIHMNSDRSKFVAVNCGAFPPTMIESELFGHVKGAFTGAITQRKGKFEEADGGTIFLDEVGELEPLAQVKLLRVLDAGEIQRVGADRTWTVNVRVIAATNRNIEDMVRDGRFRSDLYFRLAQCHLFIPPLRERRDEIPVMFDYFVEREAEKYGKPPPLLDPEARRYIYDAYDFPGNVRELKNIAEYACHIYQDRPVTIADLPERFVRAYQSSIAKDRLPPERNVRRAMRDEAEREYLITLLTRLGGAVEAVAQELGVSRSRAYQLLKKHGLRAGEYTSRAEAH